MAGKELLTREDLLRETFNNSEIDTKDVQKFLIYFGGILQLGISEGLIDEAGRNFIANAITNAIETKTTSDDEYVATNYVQIRNYMYIVSSYLYSKSKWDAWLELTAIKSNEDAYTLLDNATNWLNKKLTSYMELLNDIKLSVVKVKVENVSNAYKILVAITKNALASTSDITNFDVKVYHNSALSIGTYILMEENKLQNEENFFEELCNTIYSFCMEVSILSKINAKKVLSGKKREANGYFRSSQIRVAELDCTYKEKLSELKKEYDKKSKKCKDSMALQREYSDAKFKLEKEWEEKSNQLENFLEKEELLQLELLGGEYSLLDLIKEYAIYAMALNEKIVYPETMKERSSMLMVLNTKDAISEFISGNEQILTSKEIEFLKKIA